MSRTHLLGAVSAAALALSSTAFATTTTPVNIQGGGSTLAEFDYVTEFGIFNASFKPANFNNSDWSSSLGKPNQNLYWFAGSGSGQLAFLNDDLSCDKDKVLGTGNSSNCDPAPGVTTVAYGASDATLSSTQISSWAGSTYGQAVSGNLIQIPSMGVGISIPVNNASVTTNGGLSLSDNDLCGIFSGKITDWSQLEKANGGDVNKPLTAGQITVVYRNDGSGTSFIFTNHLANVCTTGPSGNSAIAFSATQKFYTLFPVTVAGGNVIVSSCGTEPGACFVGEKGSNGIADFMETGSGSGGATLNPISSGISYLTPDFTSLYASTTNAVLDGGAGTSQLIVASVLLGKSPVLPTLAAILSGLTHPGAGATFTAPPTGAANAADPNQWVSVIPKVTAGYPIVGYTTLDLAQCYTQAPIAQALKNYLGKRFSNATYTTIQKNNGFVPVPTAFHQAIVADLLSNANGYNTDIQNPAACTGVGTGTGTVTGR